MFKKLVAIAFAALITASAVTGCGNNSGATRADSRTETDSRDDGNTNETDASLNEEPTSADSQDGQKHYDALRYADGDLFSVKSVDPSKVKFEDHIIPEIWEKEDGSQVVQGYKFDLENYLCDYGMTEVKLLKCDEREMVYSFKFKNNLVLGFYFSPIDDGCFDDEDYELTEVVVSACTQDYDVPDYNVLRHAEKSKIKGLASWMRVVDFRYHGGEVDTRFTVPDYNNKDRYEPYYLSDGRLLSFYESKELFIPADFDETFKTYVAPYFKLRTIGLDKDPLKNKIK